jgi:hypothetical protein
MLIMITMLIGLVSWIGRVSVFTKGLVVRIIKGLGLGWICLKRCVVVLAGEGDRLIFTVLAGLPVVFSMLCCPTLFVIIFHFQ